MESDVEAHFTSLTAACLQAEEKEDKPEDQEEEEQEDEADDQEEDEEQEEKAKRVLSQTTFPCNPMVSC